MSFHVETPTLCSNERGIDVHLNLIYFNTTASKLLDCKGLQEEGGALPCKPWNKDTVCFPEADCFLFLFMILLFLNENFISLRNMSRKATHSSVTLWQDDIVIDYSCKSFFWTNYVIYSHRLHGCSAHIHACGATLCFLFSLFLHEQFFAAERTESWRTHAREKRGHIRREKERESTDAYIYSIHSLKQILSFAHSQDQHKVILFCVREHLCMCIHLGTHLLCFFPLFWREQTQPSDIW